MYFINVVVNNKVNSECKVSVMRMCLLIFFGVIWNDRLDGVDFVLLLFIFLFFDFFFDGICGFGVVIIGIDDNVF